MADPTALFTTAEARTYDKLQLADALEFSDAAIAAKEAEIREWLERVCRVNFIPTTHSDEYHDGDGSQLLMLDWPRVTSVSAAAWRSGASWTPLTVSELAELYPAASTGGRLLYRESGVWTAGVRNWKLTYIAGYTAVPSLVKQAALQIAVNELPPNMVPFEATGYDAGGGAYTWSRGDGYGGNWHALPLVMKAIRMYSSPVVA